MTSKYHSTCMRENAPTMNALRQVHDTITVVALPASRGPNADADCRVRLVL